MPLSDSDRIRLQHMLDAADQAIAFTAGQVRSSLDADTKLRFALVHAITVLGEAASRVSPSARSVLPAVPWSSIVGMRNRLVHAYFDIDADVLWASVTESLPPLSARLREFLEQDAHRE